MVKYEFNADEYEVLVRALRYFQEHGRYGAQETVILDKILSRVGQNP